MATLEYSWDSDNPVSSNKAGLGYLNIQNTLKMIYERMAVEHNMDNVLLPTAEQDGTHKQVTLKEKESAPDALSGAGKVYSRTIDETVDLCYKDNEGNETRLTVNGEEPGMEEAFVRYKRTADQNIGDTWTDINFDVDDGSAPGDNISISSGRVSVVNPCYFFVQFTAGEDQAKEGEWRFYRNNSEVLLYFAEPRQPRFMLIWVGTSGSFAVQAKNAVVKTGCYIEMVAL